MNIELIKSRIVEFDKKNHPAWDDRLDFASRITNLPLYFLEFNHHEKDNKTQSITITHYVPCKSEIIALSKIIKSFKDDFLVCDIGCGNGFIGSLLAREKVNIYGIDDRSYKQPQIYNFYDNQCYKVYKSSISDKETQFDVAFCSWMSPGLNLTPLIVEKNPKIIIHIFSPDRQHDGTLTTGTPESYLPLPNYNFHVGWNSFMPNDFFSPIREQTGLELAANPQKLAAVVVYTHKDLITTDKILPSDIFKHYDWDLEREFINNMRQKMGLPRTALNEINFTT